MPRFITVFIFLTLAYSLSAQVRAFSEVGFHGKEVVLPPGTYSAGQLQAKGIASIQSLRIPKGCNVKRYTTANLQGEATSYSKNKPKMGFELFCKF